MKGVCKGCRWLMKGVHESDRAREQWVAAVYASLFLGVRREWLKGVDEGS